MKKREIPLKNYFISLIIVIGVVLLTFYIVKVYKISEEMRLSESVLSRTIGEVKYEEIDSVLLEKADSYFIYLSYPGDKEVYETEKELKDLITVYDLQDHFYYINITDEIDDELVAKINKDFNLKKDNKIKNLPSILYYKEGKLDKTFNKATDVFTLDDLKKFLIAEYEMTK